MVSKMVMVGPAKMMKNNKIPASDMLRLLRIFTPPSRPRSTEIRATAVTPVMIAICTLIPDEIPNR